MKDHSQLTFGRLVNLQRRYGSLGFLKLKLVGFYQCSSMHYSVYGDFAMFKKQLKSLPIFILSLIQQQLQTLCSFCQQCHAYAKALHYKEMEFEGAQSMEFEVVQAMSVETQPQPVSAVEALIHINNQLNQHEVWCLIFFTVLLRRLPEGEFS